MRPFEAVRVDPGAEDPEEERWRPGVVILAGRIWLQVAYGCSTAPEDLRVPHTVIRPGSLAAVRLKLGVPTYFQGLNYCYERPSGLELLGEVCPTRQALEIRALVIKAGATLPEPF